MRVTESVIPLPGDSCREAIHDSLVSMADDTLWIIGIRLSIPHARTDWQHRAYVSTPTRAAYVRTFT